MSTLQGRVAVITGASRGIGRALALGLAKAGCHIVVAAKSTTSTEKLPGSIFTVAAEVEALGAQALPVQVDVRDEQQEEALTSLAPSGRHDAIGRLGHYEILQLIGRGAFGIVFRAFDDMLQRVVAVKVMAPQLAATSQALNPLAERDIPQ